MLELLIKENREYSASELADKMTIDRTNISRYLNDLYKTGLVEKLDGRPVKYRSVKRIAPPANITFDNLIGREESLKNQIQKSKAAILYPPRGLHTIIFGETGTGKTMFAECMYRFAISTKVLSETAPFITFNCADYAQNPQLLYGHIFGVKKGAFTGAEENREGLVAQADGGILFLDEIHRLPPEGQEMLFTFIDKGVYRPLGAGEEKTASVQILGATTETSASFLATFNRRIPMQIDLPSLEERSLDERLAIIKEFLQQESNRLLNEISIDKKSLLAFMLYKAEGNIGQLKRDLKLVCARAFLHYQTQSNQEKLVISTEDLPVNVQKGLLRMKEIPDKLSPLLDNKNLYLTFKPGKQEVVWSQDPTKSMEVYNSITYKLDTLNRENLSDIDLEELISDDVEQYFENYVEELSHTNTYREIIPEDLWQLTNKLYEIASEKLEREYDEKVLFAFALHINSTIERLRSDQIIPHPDLNNIRRRYSKEFQLAIELSGIIEEAYDILIPLDEIGFITMFLTLEITENKEVDDRQVAVVVLMHGKSTASSMLETVQELLGTKKGIAFDMPLTMQTEEMYGQLRNYIAAGKENFSEGVLILTDMGSPNDFGDLLFNEMGIRAKVISMASTMIVLESLRLALLGRSLEDMYHSVTTMFAKMVQLEEPKKDQKKVIIVACFTGEGVAAKLNEVVSRLVDPQDYEVIQMQFLERESFKHRIDQLLVQKDIVAIIGTMEIDYQQIPFIPAMNLFDRQKIIEFQNILGTKITLEDMANSLTDDFSQEINAKELFFALEDTLQKVRMNLDILIDPNVLQGILIHIAFLIDKLKKGQHSPDFAGLEGYLDENQAFFQEISRLMAPVEQQYEVELSAHDKAYLVKMLKDNQIQPLSFVKNEKDNKVNV